jgi:hypothetical protein
MLKMTDKTEAKCAQCGHELGPRLERRLCADAGCPCPCQSIAPTDVSVETRDERERNGMRPTAQPTSTPVDQGMMDSLLPCPFCGGRAEAHEGWVFCSACGVGYDGEGAEASWNARPSTPIESTDTPRCTWRDEHGILCDAKRDFPLHTDPSYLGFHTFQPIDSTDTQSNEAWGERLADKETAAAMANVADEDVLADALRILCEYKCDGDYHIQECLSLHERAARSRTSQPVSGECLCAQEVDKLLRAFVDHCAGVYPGIDGLESIETGIKPFMRAVRDRGGVK